MGLCTSNYCFSAELFMIKYFDKNQTFMLQYFINYTHRPHADAILGQTITTQLLLIRWHICAVITLAPVWRVCRMCGWLACRSFQKV